MEQFSDLIKNRRSMRKFTDQELTQEEVVALLKAALMARLLNVAIAGSLLW